MLKIIKRSLFEQMPLKNKCILAACSGGPDSVALLFSLKLLSAEFKYKIVVGHINHKLRKASGRDEMFVRGLCKKLGIPLYVKSVNVAGHAEKYSKSVEEAARDLRYKALLDIAGDRGCEVIATGHNLNDQAETIMMNIVRGAGGAGVSGIPRYRDVLIREERFLIIRPLIDVSREAIVCFLKRNHLKYRKDLSNYSSRFRRNRFRHKILPSIKKENPEINERLGSLGRIHFDEEIFWSNYLNDINKSICRRKKEDFILDLRRFMKYHKVIKRRFLRMIFGIKTFGQIEELLDFITNKRLNKFFVGDGVLAEKSRHSLVFKKRASRGAGVSGQRDYCHIINIPGENVFKEIGWRFKCNILEKGPVANLNRGLFHVYLDIKKITGSKLICRSWMPGDKFKPLGMRGHKKIQDFFIDNKVERVDRKKIPIIALEDEIIWLVGYRISEDFKVVRKTGKVLEVIAQKL